MNATRTCDHDIRVRGDQKVCATCKVGFGLVYSLDRLQEQIQFLLGRVTAEYDTLKAKFLADAAKDPSSAIRWLAYDLLVLQHRAEYAQGLLDAMGGARSTAAKLELLRDEKTRLIKILTRDSAAEWDSSTSPFGNQDMKARTVADARSLKAVTELSKLFEKIGADRNLPRMD